MTGEPRVSPDPIQPALTPEEWANLLPETTQRLAWANAGHNFRTADFLGTPDPFSFRSGHGEYSDSLSVKPERRHTLAALALYGQPFGFTREDVEMLRSAAEIPGRDDLHDLAARIEALLPPEGRSPE